HGGRHEEDFPLVAISIDFAVPIPVHWNATRQTGIEYQGNDQRGGDQERRNQKIISPHDFFPRFLSPRSTSSMTQAMTSCSTVELIRSRICWPSRRLVMRPASLSTAK